MSDPAGHAASITQEISCHATIAAARAAYPGLPVVLLGESMGASISLMVAADDPDISAVIADSPFARLDEPIAKRLQRFDRLGTIDMRVDYLRQAIGERFEVRAQVLRLGSRVANLQMSFWGPGEELIATGAAAFIVS